MKNRNNKARTIKIQIVNSELLKRLVEFLLCLCWPVTRVPELTRDKQLIARHNVWDDLLESCPNFLLVTVDQGKIKMTVVPMFNCVLDLGSSMVNAFCGYLDVFTMRAFLRP